MKKFFSVIKRNLFYIALIAGMAVLVTMVTLYNMKMQSKDKSDSVVTEEANANNTESANKPDVDKIQETISGKKNDTTEASETESEMTEEEDVTETENDTDKTAEAQLIFDGSESIAWPITGNVIIPYSMDTTVYFETLSEYKCSPAMVIEAKEGDEVKAVYKGKVVEVSSNPEIGNYMVLDLGDGYKVTYGQLQDVDVALGDVVDMGTVIGTVAAPSRYYTEEGTNLYFAITKDDKPVDPMALID
ncbi:MAG: peptidoglycan DD-metalloendopeptidase family protein [Coprococcus sp.]